MNVVIIWYLVFAGNPAFPMGPMNEDECRRLNELVPSAKCKVPRAFVGSSNAPGTIFPVFEN